MQQIFIELWNINGKWRALTEAERAKFVDGLSEAIRHFTENGLNIVAWGFNEPQIDKRAPYDAFAVYTMENEGLLAELQFAISNSGWYEYFDQVNVGGGVLSPPDVLKRHIDLDTP